MNVERERRGTVPLLSHMAQHLHGALPDPAHRGADVQVTTVPVLTQPAHGGRLKGSKAHEQPCDELVGSTMMNASRLIHKETQCKECTVLALADLARTAIGKFKAWTFL